MAVAEATKKPTGTSKGGSVRVLAVVVLLVSLVAVGGYWSVTFGPWASRDSAVGGADSSMPPTNVVFVELDTLVVSLGPNEAGQHLLFGAYLEVHPDHEMEVRRLLPRVLDVLNGYLRAIDLSELADPTSLAVLRAQMLRRIQTVTGPGRVQDLLISQFVVN